MNSVFSWMATLGDPVRARMLRVIEQQELSVGEISAVLQLPQSTTSRHLKLLSDDDWLSSRRDGTSRMYRLARASLTEERARLWELLRTNIGNTTSDDERLERVLQARQTRSEAFFEGAAAQWDKLRVELFGEQLDERILPALLSPDQVVADLGCGTGRFSEHLAPFAKRIIAVDSSPAMSDAAQARLERWPNVDLKRTPLEALQIDDDEVDLALLVLVLHYLTAPEQALREVKRILKPGGRVVIVDMQPHERAEYEQQMGHRWLGFEQARLEQWLTTSGLADVRYTPLPPDPSSKGPALFACWARKLAR
jgi:ArsR family transcriptional regulator